MAGRPKAIIDWKKVDQMLQAACTGPEIAAALGFHPDTLYNACKQDHKTDFSAYSQAKRAHGDLLLKTAQFKKAMDGDNTMQIWLGKNRLGQSERNNVKHEVNGASLWVQLHGLMEQARRAYDTEDTQPPEPGTVAVSEGIDSEAELGSRPGEIG